MDACGLTLTSSFQASQDDSSVKGQRPHGFRHYIAEHGFHTVYLLTTSTGNSPIKIGIARDPVRRLGSLQAGHFEELKFHRFWWVPGHPIAARIERAFKEHFASSGIRGEWFAIDPSKAELFVVETIRLIGSWGIDQTQMTQLMEQWELHRLERSLTRMSPAHLLGLMQQVRWPPTRLAR